MESSGVSVGISRYIREPGQASDPLSGPRSQDDQEKKEQRSCQKGPRPRAAYSLHQLRSMRAQGQGH